MIHCLNILDRSKLKMKGKIELSMLFIGLGFFIFDLVSDLYVAVQYKRAGENQWFALTLTLIIFPFFVINIMATCQMKGRVNCDVRCTGVICFYIVFARFGEEFKQWKRAYLDTCPCDENDKECNCTACKEHREAINESRQSAYQFVWIHYVETFTESIPQWCFQVYVMLDKCVHKTTMINSRVTLISSDKNLGNVIKK